MSNGMMIDSKPLTAEVAGEVIKVLQQVTITGGSAASYLAMCLSLERIATGADKVTTNGVDKGEN